MRTRKLFNGQTNHRSIVEELDIRDFTVIIWIVIENTIIDVVISSALERIILRVDLGAIGINNFLEDGNFFFKVSLLFVEDICLVLEILDGTCVLWEESSFFTSALFNIGLVSSYFSFEFNDFLLNLDEISLVDLNLLFELKFVLGSSNVRSDLIFLSLSNLSLDGSFKRVK